MALQAENYIPALKAGAVVNTADDVALASGKVLVGGTDGLADAVDMTGDVTINTSGVTAVGAKKVTVAKMGITAGNLVRGSSGGAGEEIKGTANQILVMDGAGGFPGWYNVGGDLSQSTGSFTINDSIVKIQNVTVNSTTVKGLRASAAQIIPAPGMGRAIVLDEATIKLVPNAGAAYAEDGGGSNLAFKLENGSGVQVSEDIEMTGFITQTTSYITTTQAKKDAIVDQTGMENKALVLHNIGAGEITGDAGNIAELRVSVKYRIINV